jgi:outer membrane protein assembly factor BamB
VGVPVEAGSAGGSGAVFFVAVGREGVWTAVGDVLTHVDLRQRALSPGRKQRDVPSGLAVGGGRVWVAGDESLRRVDPATARTTGAVDTSLGVGFPVYADGRLWLDVLSGPGEVRAYDSGTLAQVASVPVPGRYLFGLAAGDGRLWALDEADGRVWQIDPATRTVRELTRLPGHPVSLAERDGELWVGVQAAGLS